jgi:hypothetical protein
MSFPEMESVWLSENGFSKHSNKMMFSRSPFLGVFTDEPRKLARRLVRPKTPFVPAPEGRLKEGLKWTNLTPWSENFVDSGSVGFPDGLTEPECGISFF